MFDINNFVNCLEILKNQRGVVLSVKRNHTHDSNHDLKVYGLSNDYVVVIIDEPQEPLWAVNSFDRETILKFFTNLIKLYVYNRDDIGSGLDEDGELIGDVVQDHVQYITTFIANQYGVEFATDVLKGVIRSLNCDVHPDSMIVQIYYSMLFKGTIDAKYGRLVEVKKD